MSESAVEQIELRAKVTFSKSGISIDVIAPLEEAHLYPEPLDKCFISSRENMLMDDERVRIKFHLARS